MPGGSEKQRWLVLAAATLALGMTTIDTSIVRVALPTIQREFSASDVYQQWIVDAYLLTMGTFAITVAGDLLTHGACSRSASSVFISSSMNCSLAPSTGVLIAARALRRWAARS